MRGKLEHSLNERPDESGQLVENGSKAKCANALFDEVDTALYDALGFLQQPTQEVLNGWLVGELESRFVRALEFPCCHRRPLLLPVAERERPS